MALFESYERRIDQINAALNKYGISSIEGRRRLQRMLVWTFTIRSGHSAHLL